MVAFRDSLHAWLDRYIFCSIERKLAVAFMLVVLLPLLGTGLYGNWITSKILTDQAVETAMADLKVRASRIESYLAGVRDDLLYLSRTDVLHALIQARQQGDVARVAELRSTLGDQFALFAKTHPEYYQIRYIAEDGQEFVRVNARRGIIEIVPPSGLQLKFQRYYFQEAMRLRSGEIYMSPVDLNREYGRIEFPPTPVVRYATPLFFPDGRRAGILIINLFADEFLRFVYESEHRDELIMADQDGYYMVHPDPRKTWGHPWDRATGHRVQLDYPLHWTEILTPGDGVLMTRGDVIVHVPVFPDADNRARYWVLLRVQPKPLALAAVQSFRITAGGILFLAIVVSLLMGTTLAHSISAPIRLLTDRMRRLGRGEQDLPLSITSNDEIGELARAFDEMEAALRLQLERLELLDIAGRRITARLERAHILEAVGDALDMLFDAPCKAVRAHSNGQGDIIVCKGENTYLAVGNTEEVARARAMAAEEKMWQPARVPWPDGTIVYVCCAAMSSGSQVYGWIELYGPHPDVIDPAVGNLLTSLALQAGTALENADLYRQLEQQRERLHWLVKQLIAVQEEERRVIAYDIHDGLIQRLVGARLHLLSLGEENTLASEEDRRLLQRAIEHLSATIAEARRTIEGLRPALLDELGLVPALEQYALDLSRQGGWQVHMRVAGVMARLPDSVEITAFRIAQEALNNVYKYARAGHVHISIERRDHTLVLEIRDDGVGFDTNAVRQRKHCVGLMSMQERARLLGGTCTIHSEVGHGTLVRAELPIRIGKPRTGGEREYE